MQSKKKREKEKIMASMTLGRHLRSVIRNLGIKLSNPNVVLESRIPSFPGHLRSKHALSKFRFHV